MPTVPRLSGPQVQQGNLPNRDVRTDAPIEAFGGGAGRDRMFDAAMGIAEKAKKNGDDLAVQEADRKLSEMETDLLYNPKSGIHNKLGKDSFGLPDEINERYTKNENDIASELTNDVQRRRFQEMSARRKADTDRTVSRHVSEQIKQYDNSETEAFLQSEKNRAIKNYQDPVIVESSLANQKIALAKYADRNGINPEVLKLRIQMMESGTHKEIVDRMLANGDDMYAQKYYEANKGLLEGKDLEQVEKDVLDGSIRGNSQRLTAEVMKKGMPMSQALEVVKEQTKSNPKLQDAAVERLKQEYALKETAKKDWLTNAQIQAGNHIDKYKDIDKYKAENPRVWEQLSINEKENLEKYATAKKLGKPIQTNWGKYSDLHIMAATPAAREKFLETDPMSFRNDLADAEYKEVLKLQDGLRKGDSKIQKQLDGFQTDIQTVEGSMSRAGINRKSSNYSEVRQLINDQVAVHEQRTGKKATSQELNEISNTMLVEVITKKKSFWFDEKKKVYELDENDRPVIEFKDIPKSERIKIEEYLKKSGKMIDDRKFVELYTNKLLGLGKK